LSQSAEFASKTNWAANLRGELLTGRASPLTEAQNPYRGRNIGEIDTDLVVDLLATGPALRCLRSMRTAKGKNYAL